MCEVIEKDLYAVLGACPSDSAQQLKHKYQELALQVNIAPSFCTIVLFNQKQKSYLP